MLEWAGVPGLLGSLAGISIWKAIGWIALAAYKLLLAALVFRRLGTDGFALWVVILSTRSVLVLLAGVPAAWTGRTAGFAAKDPEARRSHDPRLRLYLGIAALVVIFGFGVATVPALLLRLAGPAADAARWVGVLMVADAAVAIMTGPMAVALRSRMRFNAVALASVAQAAAGLVLAWALIGRWGLVGIGIAVLGSRLLAGFVCFLFLSSSGTPRGSHPAMAGWRELVSPDAPLRVLTISKQLAIAAGILIVAGWYGSADAAAYGLGAAIPAIAGALLFAVLDLAFPRLTQAHQRESERLRRWMLVVGGAFGALGFGAIALNAAALLRVWVGTAPSLAVLVLVIFAAVGLLSVPGHVLALAAVATGRSGTHARIVIGEGMANVALGVLLAATYSAVGPALAAVATTFVSGVVVLPLVLRRPLSVSLPYAALQGLLGVGVGLALSGVVWVASSRLPAGPLGPVIGAFVGTAIAALGFVSLGPRIGRWLSRWWMVVHLGGWSVWIRQRNEVTAARKRLQSDRLTNPVVWRQSSPPLVSVRIATYNSGRLVAERAIASALNQTHKNIEVVVVGDHCDEETERAVRSVSDPRVRFENLSRRGDYPSDPARRWMVAGTVPMNRALDLARGEWIAPLDDDDEFTPDHVEVLLDACRSRDLEFAYGVAEMEVQPNAWELIGWWPLADGGIVHASVLYMARIAFLRHDIEAWKLWEPGDWNLWRRMRAAGVRMGFVNKVVCRHYLGNPAAAATP